LAQSLGFDSEITINPTRNLKQDALPYHYWSIKSSVQKKKNILLDRSQTLSPQVSSHYIQ
jgi:hypothetical protein